MYDAYEQTILNNYLYHLISTIDSTHPIAATVAAWVRDEGASFGLRGLCRLPLKPRVDDDMDAPNVPPKDWEALLNAVNEHRQGSLDAPNSPLQENINALARVLGLSKDEKQVLEFAARLHMVPEFEHLLNSLLQKRHMTGVALVSAVIPLPRDTLYTMMTESEKLVTLGMFGGHTHLERDELADIFYLYKVIVHALQVSRQGLKDLKRILFGVERLGKLNIDDFQHMATERDFIMDLVKGARAEGATGINILLYGAAGTGKTELCKAIAAHLGMTLYTVGEQTADNSEPEREDRLYALALAQSLFKNDKKALLLFDEMEDLLQDADLFSPTPRAGAKVYLNSLLENNAVPTFWTCNNIKYIKPSMIRRMTFAVQMGVPTAAARQQIWGKLAHKHALALDSQQVQRLAADYDASPAIAATAMNAARLAGGGEARVRHALENLSQAVRGGSPARAQATADVTFAPELTNADMDLSLLITRLQQSAQKRFSLCLYGAAGTGKSAFVRYMAQELGMDVVQKRASDLLSSYVGDTETNIAAAFAEAKAQQAFLVFDEADSFLQDRREAVRSWETTQVNEMLTWMEHHDYPFACTTNLMERMDIASLRRFTFKIKFDFLLPAQVGLAFERFFALPCPASLLEVQNLTTGDFATIHRKASVLGVLQDAPALAEMLVAEGLNKPHASRRIGF